MLIDHNRWVFKEIFCKHLSENEGKYIQYSQLVKFCAKVKLYPDIISSIDIKRICSIILGKVITEEKAIQLHYLHFEKVLKVISEQYFPSYKHLISYIKPPCQTVYLVNLLTIPPLSTNAHTVSPYKKNLQTPVSLKYHNVSVRNMKLLNNSNSQKLTTVNDRFAIEQNINIKNSTSTTNTSKIRSPRLKIISIQDKLQNKSLISKVFLSFSKLKSSLKSSTYPLISKKLYKTLSILNQANTRIVIPK